MEHYNFEELDNLINTQIIGSWELVISDGGITILGPCIIAYLNDSSIVDYLHSRCDQTIYDYNEDTKSNINNPYFKCVQRIYKYNDTISFRTNQIFEGYIHKISREYSFVSIAKPESPSNLVCNLFFRSKESVDIFMEYLMRKNRKKKNQYIIIIFLIM